MKSHKQNSSTEEAVEKRRTSASVDEIRDLYSALQGLVPSTLPTIAMEEKTGTVKMDSKRDTHLEPSVLIKRSSYPLISITQPQMAGRNRSKSFDAVIGLSSSSRQRIVRQDSVLSYCQSKRLLKNTTRTQEELFTIVKDFDDVEINHKRGRSQSLDSLLKTITTSSSVVNDNHVTCDTVREQLELSNASDIRKTGNSNPEICNVSSENADKMSRQDFENILSPRECDAKSFYPGKKRLSAGDILEKQRARFSDPRTPYRRRSIGGSLLLSAIVGSSSAPPTRKASLGSALTLLARKNELQKLLKNYQDIKLNGNQRENEKDETDAGQQVKTGISDDLKSENKNDIQREVERLLTSIEELNQDSTDLNLEEVLNKTGGVRRASVGTEMHNLLEAIQELMVSGQTTPASSTPSGSRTSSRRTSLNEPRLGIQKESLDDLEAYFKTKLEDISEHDSTKSSSAKKLSKTSKEVKTTDTKSAKRERLVANANRRNSASQLELGISALNATGMHKSSSSVDLLKPSDALQYQRQQVGGEPQDTSRRRSRTAESAEYRFNIKSASSSPREISRSTSTESQIDRALWKEDQVMFANQVNKRLQDWLERATSLSIQEAEKPNHDKRSEDNHFVISCSSDNDTESKTKKSRSRFGMKKVLRKKIKRSKSIHNLSQPEEKQREKSPRFKRANKKVKRSKSLHSLLDVEDSQPKQTKEKTKIFRSPQSLLRIGRQHFLGPKSWKKPQLESKDSKTTESDESFDDANSSFSINHKSSDSPKTNRLIDDVEPKPNMQTMGSRRSSFPSQKEIELLENKRTFNSKRLSKFPGHMPLFYTPGSNATLKTSKDSRSNKQSTDSIDVNKHSKRKSWLFGNAEIKHAIFYEQTNMQSSVALAIPQCKSPGLDEGYIRSPSQEWLNDTPSTSPDFNDFRDRTKSTESEDSGCPI